MSSMAEGSEGWAREDELDLGPQDDQSPQPDHDLPDDHAGPSPQEPPEGEFDAIDHAQDQATELPVDAAPTSLPHTPPAQQAAWGSVDGTASTPDDSPSLHVSRAMCAHPGISLLIDCRNPYSHRKAVPWHFEARPE